MFPENKILDLAQLLKTRVRGIRRRDLELRWNCSAATVRRVVQSVKVEFGLPIVFQKSKGVYLCDFEKAIELPGLWFGPEELTALLGLSHWLDNLGSGILQELLQPFRERMESMLKARNILLADWRDRIRFLPMASRPIHSGLLVPAARAVLDRKRLAFGYKGLLDPAYSDREVSPQTLVSYRDNWLLDAFCHKQKGLRSFALSRMKNLQPLRTLARDIPRPELDRHFGDAYGIFGGRAKHSAAIVFEGLAARLVENESWHPKQKLQRLPGGKLRLEFPCGDLRELVRDLMRFADEVTVEKPELLRMELEKTVRRASGRYPP